MNPLERCLESCLVSLDSTGDGLPVYFVHPAGGYVLCYRELARRLKRPAYAFQAIGLIDPAYSMIDVVEMAGCYIRAMQQHQPHGPYTLGGWSTGSVIAYEMAHQLLAQGEAVEKVIVLDAPSPHDIRPVTEVEMLTWFLEDVAPNITVGLMAGLELDIDNDANNLRQAILLLPEEYQAGLDAAALIQNFRVFRSVIRSSREYWPVGIDVELALCRAKEQVVEEFRNHPFSASDDWGWDALSPNKVLRKTVQGSHYSFLNMPYVQSIALFINRLTHKTYTNLKFGTLTSSNRTIVMMRKAHSLS